MNKTVSSPELHQDIFNEGGWQIENMRLFFAYYREIPNRHSIDDVDETRFGEWLQGELDSRIVAKHVMRKYNRKFKRDEHDDLYFLLDEPVMIHVEPENIKVFYSSQSQTLADAIVKSAKRFIKRRRRKPEIHVIISGPSELETRSLQVGKPQVNVSKHYNDDLADLHSSTIKTLRRKNKSGLHLFHGAPGTGKSTYIRHLLHRLDKKVLFISPALAANLDTPAMCRLLIKNDNAVFVIEDAEELMVCRDNRRSSAISVLLNLTDGLLGESLGIQVIATFNTNLRHVDPALMRKGRLLTLYEFKPLAASKAKMLLEERGIHELPAAGELTLAEIFHAEQPSYKLTNNNRETIGFRAHSNFGT
jgi:hypothetical protein